MADITNPKLLYLKGLLFLVLGLLASGLLIMENPTLRTGALIVIAVWSFCRLYYFMFYVIQHYIDPAYRYAGILDFLRYSWRRSEGGPVPKNPEPGEAR